MTFVKLTEITVCIFFSPGIFCLWKQLSLPGGWIWLFSELEKWRKGILQLCQEYIWAFIALGLYSG